MILVIHSKKKKKVLSKIHVGTSTQEHGLVLTSDPLQMQMQKVDFCACLALQAYNSSLCSQRGPMCFSAACGVAVLKR